jgi:hypothetical protein
MGWEEVRNLPEAKDFDDVRKVLLSGYTDEARKRIPDAVVQAYCIVVTVAAKGEVEAFRITASGEPVFETVKNDKRSRIQESAISPEALLPDGPYALWRAGETSRRASDLTRAFAQFPHLPKMLRQKDIADTLALGAEQGYFVLRLVRPDKSVRTIWRIQPTENDLRERDLEVVLPEAAELTQIDGGLLAPGALPALWPEAAESIALGDVLAFFDGSHACKVQREGYEEVFPVPKAAREVVEEAVKEAVRAGSVWLTAGPASIYREDNPLWRHDRYSATPPATRRIPSHGRPTPEPFGSLGRTRHHGSLCQRRSLRCRRQDTAVDHSAFCYRRRYARPAVRARA